MKSARIEIQENLITISNPKRPIFILSIFTFFGLLSFLIPILGTILKISKGEGLKFGLFLSYLFCWGIATYFVRIILWNLYGQEVLLLHNNNLNYYCSYKFFNDNMTTLDLQNIEITPTLFNKELESTLTLKSQDKILETSFLLSKKDIESITMKIKNVL